MTPKAKVNRTKCQPYIPLAPVTPMTWIMIIRLGGASKEVKVNKGLLICWLRSGDRVPVCMFKLHFCLCNAVLVIQSVSFHPTFQCLTHILKGESRTMGTASLFFLRFWTSPALISHSTIFTRIRKASS